jgi:hypothetical protein
MPPSIPSLGASANGLAKLKHPNRDKLADIQAIFWKLGELNWQSRMT